MAILPTLLIIVVGLLIMVLVIPYAFSSVFKQLQVEKEISRIREEMEISRIREEMEINRINRIRDQEREHWIGNKTDTIIVK